MLRSPVFVVLLVVMLMGIAFYMKLWAIDFSFTAQDNDILRKQFDLANREAMEESAEWRLKYDEEVERGTERLRELIQVKEDIKKKTDRLAALEKENLNLLERVKSLTRQLESVKLKCKT